MIGEAVSSVPTGRFLSRWEPRAKLIGILLLAFAFATVQDLWLLLLMLGITLVVFALSSLPVSYLAGRMKVPGLFLLVMALVLPFFAGTTVLFRLGPVSIKQEGCLSLLTISARFLCIIVLVTVLFASTPMAELVESMRALGLPSLLGDMLLFTHRYIYQLAADFQRASTAARLRGTRMKSFRSIRTTAYIVGSLLVRSHEKAERVYQAMTLRGYGRQDIPPRKSAPRAVDLAALSACLVVAVGLVLLQYLVF